MALWLALTLMTAAALFAVLVPLARQFDRSPVTSDVAVYRDQLEEIRRDRAARQIGDEEAAAAEREVARRIIAAADASARNVDAAPSKVATHRRRAVAVAVLLLLPFGAACLYLGLGSPSLSDQPLAPRLAAFRGGQSIDSLIAQVEAHLASHPGDGRGWELIAPVYMRLGRFDDAVKARRSALSLNGESADREAALGEALVFAANGVVTAEAKATFDKAIAVDAAHPQARYFLGLAAEQEGDRERAAAIWQGLLTGAPPDAPWVAFVRAALEGMGRSVERRATGPDEEQIASSSRPSADQGDVMIRGMVERLSQRLKQDGSDPEGWLRLVRSYMVLGETDKARAAASDARRALADDPSKLRQFDERVTALVR